MQKPPRRCGIGLIIGLFIAVMPGMALALQSDEIALVVNSNVPEGLALAKFYAQQRHIPDNRILLLDLPKGDHMTTRQYEDETVPQVRDFLRSRNLDNKVKCLVTFYGVPLMIDPRVNTAAESDEQNTIRRQLIALPQLIIPPLQKVEAMAIRLNGQFVPDRLTDLEHLNHRRNAAFREISIQIATVPDQARQAELTAEFFADAEPLVGDIAQIKLLDLRLKSGAAEPDDQQKLTQVDQQYKAALNESAQLEEHPNDAKSRQRIRELAHDNFGLANYMQLLIDQVDYLDATNGGPNGTGAAFDNELAMVGWHAYPHKGFWPNPLNYKSSYAGPYHTLMVMRLDAPTPDVVRSMITTSIDVENRGLTGQVVVDSRGIKLGEEKSDEKAFALYDQYLRNLARMVSDHTQLKVLLDEKPDVLPPGSASDVALYCGWYSVRNYVPCCKFNPGAVGFHIASYELISLRQPGESGWVHGLLLDGCVSSLGAVAEPYLGTFPRPDEFFPLLLTGRLTLAEVYWKTTPTVSWMQACIGDPLYTPYKKNPALTEIDLPAQLRQALMKPAASSVKPNP
jgi:uncharacterized protein (TIGR03790 family)